MNNEPPLTPFESLVEQMVPGKVNELLSDEDFYTDGSIETLIKDSEAKEAIYPILHKLFQITPTLISSEALKDIFEHTNMIEGKHKYHAHVLPMEMIILINDFVDILRDRIEPIAREQVQNEIDLPEDGYCPSCMDSPLKPVETFVGPNQTKCGKCGRAWEVPEAA